MISEHVRWVLSRPSGSLLISVRSSDGYLQAVVNCWRPNAEHTVRISSYWYGVDETI